jgi:hypothetical protein
LSLETMRGNKHMDTITVFYVCPIICNGRHLLLFLLRTTHLIILPIYLISMNSRLIG